ncbi:MAG: heavy-metal-associated domain-containing protein [Spirulina sp. SIO3F2]|nr:heavy-metal-associated domain-containing protein [Spirulina sp. SIO3F2]
MAVQVKVPSMVCAACVRTITTAIQAQFPTAQVQTELETHLVTVQAEITPEQLQAVIVEAGHEVDA